MKILITGAAGFIGSTLSAKLLNNGYFVMGIDNFNSIYDPQLKRKNIANLLAANHFKLFENDINEREVVNRIFEKEKPDAVVHIAGVTGMKNSFDNPSYFFLNNTSGTESILEACRKNNCRQFILISTSTLYGNATIPVDEDSSLPFPSNPYALTKYLAEETTRAYARWYGIKSTILRLFTVYGPKQRPTHAIATFTRKMIANEPITIYGNGTSIRDHVYVDDVVQAILLALKNPFDFNIFNIASGSVYSINKIVQQISKVLRIEPIIEKIPHPDFIPTATRANINKASELLGYVPKTGINEGISEYINWYKQNN